MSEHDATQLGDERHGDECIERELEAFAIVERSALIACVAGHIAHEIGTPLNVIAGRASMMARGECAPDEMTESARIIAEQARKLTATVRSMVDEFRRRAPRTQEDAVALAERARAIVARAAVRRGIDVEIVASEGPLSVEVNAGRFIAALAHLMMNAIHATDTSGRVKVVVAKEISGGRAGSATYSSVSTLIEDRGHGITEEDLRRIFRPFFTTRSASGAKGLGLAIVQDIVREHGGSIEVESKLGEGTSIKVLWPEGRIHAGTRPDRG